MFCMNVLKTILALSFLLHFLNVTVFFLRLDQERGLTDIIVFTIFWGSLIIAPILNVVCILLNRFFAKTKYLKRLILINFLIWIGIVVSLSFFAF